MEDADADEQFDLTSKEQSRISKILNAKNIDDKTKFLMLTNMRATAAQPSNKQKSFF